MNSDCNKLNGEEEIFLGICVLVDGYPNRGRRPVMIEQRRPSYITLEGGTKLKETHK